MAGWSLDLEKYAEKKGESIKMCRRKVCAKIFESIVRRTPVDTGRARGNWQITVGQDDTAPIDRLDPAKGKPAYAGEEEAKLAAADGDETIFIHNNLPYICKLEFGGYPEDVKKGTYVKGKGYEKRSRGGFSMQAPHGMVGVTMAGIESRIREAVKESGF